MRARKVLPALRELREWSEEPEIDFNRRNGRYRRAVGSDGGFEAPRTHGFDGLLIQPKASALYNLDIGRVAVWLNDHLQDHNSLKLGFARIF